MEKPESNSTDILSDVAIPVDSESFFKSWKRALRKDCLWPLPVSFSCCSGNFREFKGKGLPSSQFDFVRPPEQADLLVIGGVVTHKMVPFLYDLYQSMPDERYVMAIGACASSGGPYWTQSVVQGVSQIFPVDVYLPGCPPSPAAIIQALEVIQDRIAKGLSAKEQLNWSLNV